MQAINEDSAGEDDNGVQEPLPIPDDEHSNPEDGDEPIPDDEEDEEYNDEMILQ